MVAPLPDPIDAPTRSLPPPDEPEALRLVAPTDLVLTAEGARAIVELLVRCRDRQRPAA